MFLVCVRLCVCASVLSVRSMSFVFFFLSVWISRCTSAIFRSISLLSNFPSSVCLLTFLRSLFYCLFIDWFCVRLVSLVLSLVRPMFYGCVGLSLTFIWFGGREAEYDVAPVRELMIMTPFLAAASRVWPVDAACVWVLWLVIINRLCCVLLALLCLLVGVLFCAFIYNFCFMFV